MSYLSRQVRVASGESVVVVIGEDFDPHREACAYLKWLQHGAGRSPGTARTYGSRVAAYLSWAGQSGIDWRGPTLGSAGRPGPLVAPWRAGRGGHHSGVAGLCDPGAYRDWRLPSVLRPAWRCARRGRRPVVRAAVPASSAAGLRPGGGRQPDRAPAGAAHEGAGQAGEVPYGRTAGGHRRRNPPGQGSFPGRVAVRDRDAGWRGVRAAPSGYALPARLDSA